jgi:putative DNA primase/helicase
MNHTLTDESQLDLNEDWINCSNGLLNWKTGELRPHTPRELSTIQIPVKWNPDASNAHVLSFLESIVPSDSTNLLIEMIGYCLLRNAKYQKFFIFLGTGSNGKSKLIELIEAFIGKQNRSSVSLQELESNRFRVAQLHNRLVNICADISHKGLPKTETIKKITSGDSVNAEWKGKDPFDFNPFATLIFSANALPSTQDLSEGFFRRVIIIPFPFKFTAENRDPEILEKITTEESLSCLFTLAVEGLRRLDKQQGFSENESTKEALEHYKYEADHVMCFVTEWCVLSDAQIASTKSMYEEYRAWSTENGYVPKGKKNFNRRIIELNPHLTNEHRLQRGGPRYWKGIGLLAEMCR